jgi:uroporphyrinogen decarboxylase
MVPRTPYAIDFTVPALQRLRSSPSGNDIYQRLANDICLTPVIRVEWGQRNALGRYRDEFGLEWDRSIDPDIGIPHYFVTPENLDHIPWPDPHSPGRFELLQKNLKSYPDRFHIMCLDFSLYERAWGMRGLENIYLDMAEQPQFVEALLDRILDFNLKVIEAGLGACPGIDGVHFGDDFGDQNGISMGAKRWRKLIKPRLATQYGAVKAAGKKVSIHSCGRVQELLDDLVEIGVDLFNPFQPEVMDVEAFLERYRGRLAFWGGVSIQRLLPYGTVAEVQSRVDRLLGLGRRGGYVIAPAHSVPADARVENVQALLQAVLAQG